MIARQCPSFAPAHPTDATATNEAIGVQLNCPRKIEELHWAAPVLARFRGLIAAEMLGQSRGRPGLGVLLLIFEDDLQAGMKRFPGQQMPMLSSGSQCRLSSPLGARLAR